MQIGTVAKKIGLSVDAIRFYERNALLPRAPRSEGGFRQYQESDIVTLGFIRRALRCATDLNKSSSMCIASSATFRNWNGNCGWRSEAATGSCTNDPRTAPSGRQKPTQTGEPKMKIEVLYVPDCPHHPAAILKLKEVLAAEGIAADITEVAVNDMASAMALRFCGSPTIRINGRDVAEEFGAVQNEPGVPPLEMIRRAVRDAYRRRTLRETR